jgi:uncharacterized protein (DUF305 family)
MPLRTSPLNIGSRIKFLAAAGALVYVGGIAHADEPGRGITAETEVRYLKFIADHHYAALRMTELAAGTDVTRNAHISPSEGTAPTPDKPPVSAKATMDELKSMARRNNRTQREEILTAKKWLHDWYGIDYHPRVRSMNQAQIDLLEKAQPGSSFDHLYMEVLSRHHFTALAPSTACQVESELTHDQLIRYCSGIVHSQINDIQDMRHMLCDEFSICDYQPTVGLKGRHSGHEGQQFIAGSENESMD